MKEEEGASSADQHMTKGKRGPKTWACPYHDRLGCAFAGSKRSREWKQCERWVDGRWSGARNCSVGNLYGSLTGEQQAAVWNAPVVPGEKGETNRVASMTVVKAANDKARSIREGLVLKSEADREFLLRVINGLCNALSQLHAEARINTKPDLRHEVRRLMGLEHVQGWRWYWTAGPCVSGYSDGGPRWNKYALGMWNNWMDQLIGQMPRDQVRHWHSEQKCPFQLCRAIANAARHCDGLIWEHVLDEYIGVYGLVSCMTATVLREDRNSQQRSKFTDMIDHILGGDADKFVRLVNERVAADWRSKFPLTMARYSPQRKLLLVLSVATPPASGKSTVLKGVASGIGAPVLSSDDFVSISGESDKARFERAARNACLDPKNTSNVCGCRAVVVDKNVPDENGWKKFVSIFTPIFKCFDEVYAVRFCPQELGEKEVEVIMRRMEERVPKEGKIVLSMQTPNYHALMFDFFLPSCQNSLCKVHDHRQGTMVTSKLFTDGAADTIVGDFILHMEGGPKNWLRLA
jgi:hypothetical protein